MSVVVADAVAVAVVVVVGVVEDLAMDAVGDEDEGIVEDAADAEDAGDAGQGDEACV